MSDTATGRQGTAPAGRGAVPASTGEASAGPADAGRADGVPAVRLTGVRRMYGQLAAVAGVDLEVAEGRDGPAYRLGGFRAFLGQREHGRHRRFAASRATIS